MKQRKSKGLYYSGRCVFTSHSKVASYLITFCLQTFQQKYPRIFNVAMDVLPIPASSVPCERVFSSAKRTTTPQRNRLTANLMEELQMLKFSAKQGHRLDFSCGLDWEDEIKELEMDAEMQNQYPEDVKAYMQYLKELL